MKRWILTDLYVLLRERVAEAGLLVRRVRWYVLSFVVLFVLFFAGAFALVLIDNWAVQLGLLAVVSFIMVQFGFLGHDAGHECISERKWVNNLFGHAAMTVLCGVSLSYWRKQHNSHHAHSNIDSKDPDLGHLIAFTREEKQRRRGFWKFITRIQAWLFVPSQGFSAIVPRINTLFYAFKEKRSELPLLLLHYALWIGVPLVLIGPVKTLVFYTINSFIAGWYFAFVFSTNHIGMPSPKSDVPMPFILLQASTSRNINSSWINDFLFGGLNYQIEHHLFPNLPRNKLKAVQRITKEFFQKHKLPYTCVSVAKAYKDIFAHVSSISKA